MIGNFGYANSFHSFAPRMEVQERIKEKAEELFRRYGIRSITMDEIAAQLGMSKKTLYLHFADKEDLVAAVTENVIRQNQQHCHYDFDRSGNAVEEIFLAMERVYELFSQINPAMVFDLQKYHPKGYRQFLNHREHFLAEIIRKNLKRGMEEGLYRADLNVEILTAFRMESMLIGFNPDIFPPSIYKLADVQLELMLHFLNGLASSKGMKLIDKYKLERLNKA